MSVASFRFRNFLSLRDTTLELTTPVTLLIGPNGAGKTNVMRGVELLSRLLDDTFQDSLMRGGGFSQHLFKGDSLATFTHEEQGSGFSPKSFAINASWSANAVDKNGYDVQFSRGDADSALLRERFWCHKTDQYEKPFYDYRDSNNSYRGNNGWHGLSRHSVLSTSPAAQDSAVRQRIREVLLGCRVFHFDDTSPSSPALQTCDVADNHQLHSDGRNLAAVLLRMQTSDQERYQGLLRSIRTVAPFLEDFVVTPLYEGSTSTILRWKHRGMDGVFSGEKLSSGTLRFICLTVLFQQTNLPQTIVVDEPELGLHPFAIYQLADMLHEYATEERKVVVTSQSVTLANQFALEELALVTRENGQTVITRPDLNEYRQWLEDYTVGQLWESNILGIAPQNEVKLP